MIPTTVGQDTSFFSVDASTGTVSYETHDNLNSGVYRVYVQGKITKHDGVSDFDSTSFQVTILKLLCEASTETIVITGYSITDKTYQISDQSQSLSIKEFTHNSRYCDVITYAVEVYPATSIILFDTFTRTLSWSTDNSSHIGQYTVTIRGKMTNMAGTFESTSNF